MFFIFLFSIQTFLKQCKALRTENYKRCINIYIYLLLFIIAGFKVQSDGHCTMGPLRALDSTVLRQLFLIVRRANNGDILFKGSRNFGLHVDHYLLH